MRLPNGLFVEKTVWDNSLIKCYEDYTIYIGNSVVLGFTRSSYIFNYNKFETVQYKNFIYSF